MYSALFAFYTVAKAAERRKWNDNEIARRKRGKHEMRRLCSVFTIHKCVYNCDTVSDIWRQGKERDRELMAKLRVPNLHWSADAYHSIVHTFDMHPSVVCGGIGTADDIRSSSASRQLALIRNRKQKSDSNRVSKSTNLIAILNW